MSSPVSLTYFVVSGDWRDVEVNDPASSTTTPTIEVVSATVDFIPRLPKGYTFYVDNFALDGSTHRDTAVHVGTFTARITEGQLVTIGNTDVPDVTLVSNSPALGYKVNGQPADLIYDVRFYNVVYGPQGANTLTNFAFTAPTDATPIILTSAELTRLPYAPLPS